jgi:hypothetical protein
VAHLPNEAGETLRRFKSVSERITQMTKSKVMALLVGGVAALLAGSANAGWKGVAGPSARCYSGGCSGSGAFASVRSDNNNYDEMECFQTPTYAGCMVYGNGVEASCTTTDPNYIAIIRSLNSDAYIQFSADTNGVCTSLLTYNDSGYAPKTP